MAKKKSKAKVPLKKMKSKSVARSSKKASAPKSNFSQQLWETLRENLSDSIIVADMEGKITQCNQGACDMFGYSKSEMKGMHVRNFHPEYNWDKVLPVLFKEALQEGKWESELPLVRKGNQEFQARLTVLRVSENGKPVALIGITRDLSAKTTGME